MKNNLPPITYLKNWYISHYPAHVFLLVMKNSPLRNLEAHVELGLPDAALPTSDSQAGKRKITGLPGGGAVAVGWEE